MELTELPEKWCIKSTAKTYKDIYQYINNNGSKKYFYDKWRCIEDIGNIESFVCFPSNKGLHQNKGTKNYTEISFEQFQKWVLKKEVEPVIVNEDNSFIIQLLNKYNIK